MHLGWDGKNACFWFVVLACERHIHCEFLGHLNLMFLDFGSLKLHFWLFEGQPLKWKENNPGWKIEDFWRWDYWNCLWISTSIFGENFAIGKPVGVGESSQMDFLQFRCASSSIPSNCDWMMVTSGCAILRGAILQQLVKHLGFAFGVLQLAFLLLLFALQFWKINLKN